MAVPASKAELQQAIAVTYDRLCRDLARVPADQARLPSLEGHVQGSLISPADLVAYLIGWNELVLKWLERDDRHEQVDFPETGYKWNQLGALAQKFYADFQSLEWQDLLWHLGAVNARLTATLAARPEAELYGAPWHDKWTKGRMIQLNTSSPYANARRRIRRWLKSRAP